MYRVLIVDDEEPVLESFSYILERESQDFVLCGKARSGVEAVRLICDLKPDVVFMDIQMPGIDGIDAIAQTRLQHPEIVFIVATAYERFDIAKRAIPLGVFSYLVKPISRRTLVDELARVRLHLDRTKHQTSLHLEDIGLLKKTKEETKNRMLGRLAWDNPTGEGWAHLSRLFSLQSERGTIRLIEFRDELSGEARAALFERITEKIQFKFKCLSSTIGGLLIIFFPEDQNLSGLDEHLGSIVEESTSVPVRIGAGETVHYSQLAESFAGALRALGDRSELRPSFRSEREEVQELCTILSRANPGQSLPLFEAYWMRVFRSDEFEVAKAKMVALFTLLWTRLDGQLLSKARLDFNPADAIMRLETIEEWRDWSSDVLRSLERALDNHGARDLPPKLSKALSIIHRSYDRPIQLSSIAEECQITASYLCRLFSTHLETSFVEYLTRYRIERAVELLSEECRSVKETAGLVGFQDPNYFGRIFRRYVGVSPSELANRRKR